MLNLNPVWWAIILIIVALAIFVLHERRKSRKADRPRAHGTFMTPEQHDDHIRRTEPGELEAWDRPPCETVPEIQRSERLRAGVRP